MIEELISSQSSLSVNQLLPTQIIKLCRFSKCLIFDYVIEKRWWKHWLNFFFSHDVHFFIHFVNKQPESGLSLKSWLNFLRLLRSKLLNPINHGGGPYGPPAWKSAVFGRKNEIFQKKISLCLFVCVCVCVFVCVCVCGRVCVSDCLSLSVLTGCLNVSVLNHPSWHRTL